MAMLQKFKRRKTTNKRAHAQGMIVTNAQPAIYELDMLDYTKLFAYTPKGVGCKHCKKPIPITTHCKRNIKRHVDKHGYVLDYDEWLADYELRQTEMVDVPIKQFVLHNKYGYGCECGQVFATKYQATKHIEDRLGTCTTATVTNSVPVWELLSYHVVPAEINNESDNPIIDFEYVQECIHPYIRDDENIKTWTPILAPLVFEYKKLNNDLIQTHINYMISAPNHDDLHHLLETASTWLMKDARFEVGLIPGNYRAALMVFEGNDVNDVHQNSIYTFRHKENILQPVLHKLLCYAYHTQFITLGNTSEYTSDTVPRILVNLLLEEPRSFLMHTVAVKFCLF